MTPEQRDRLLADAIAVRGDIESLIERIDYHGVKREVNPFWVKWINNVLMHDRNAINMAIDSVIFGAQVRRHPNAPQMWNRLLVAYDAASFAVSYATRLLEEELAYGGR